MDGDPGERPAFREPLLTDRLTCGQRLSWALARSVCVVAAGAVLVWATQDLVQWGFGQSAQSAQVRARWIVFLACLVLAAAAVMAHRIIGSRIGAALVGGVAATVLIMAWLPVPDGAFVAALLSCCVLLAAVVVVVVTGGRT